jgi:hypothetical protein
VLIGRSILPQILFQPTYFLCVIAAVKIPGANDNLAIEQKFLRANFCIAAISSGSSGSEIRFSSIEALFFAVCTRGSENRPISVHSPDFPERIFSTDRASWVVGQLNR